MSASGRRDDGLHARPHRVIASSSDGRPAATSRAVERGQLRWHRVDDLPLGGRRQRDSLRGSDRAGLVDRRLQPRTPVRVVPQLADRALRERGRGCDRSLPRELLPEDLELAAVDPHLGARPAGAARAVSASTSRATVKTTAGVVCTIVPGPPGRPRCGRCCRPRRRCSTRRLRVVCMCSMPFSSGITVRGGA